MQQFYVVWNVGHGLPRVQHQTFEAAKGEARRLAMLNPGQIFHVLASAGHAVKELATWVDHQPDLDQVIPF